MNSMGRALMGTGIAKGQNRARLAAEMAVSSPLLDDISVDGATGVLINIVGGPDLKMREIQEAASLVQEQAHEEANIIFGASIDEQLGENVKVTVIATGFDVAERMATLDHAARAQIPTSAPSTVPSMQMPQHAHAARQAHAQALFASQPPPPPPPRMDHGVPAFSNRRVSHAPISREAHPQDPRMAPASGRIPTRERNANFPAFDTDWDVPAFQRKGQ
jgi:cell division protein FtsZ